MGLVLRSQGELIFKRRHTSSMHVKLLAFILCTVFLHLLVSLLPRTACIGCHHASLLPHSRTPHPSHLARDFRPHALLVLQLDIGARSLPLTHVVRQVNRWVITFWIIPSSKWLERHGPFLLVDANITDAHTRAHGFNPAIHPPSKRAPQSTEPSDEDTKRALDRAARPTKKRRSEKTFNNVMLRQGGVWAGEDAPALVVVEVIQVGVSLP